MWTNEIYDCKVVGGNLVAYVKYIDDTTNETLYEQYPTSEQQDGWPLTIVRNRTAQLNALDPSKVPLGPVPEEKPVVDERAVFIDLCSAYRDMATQFETDLAVKGATVLTQADLDAKKAEIKAAYQSEFAKFVVGIF